MEYASERRRHKGKSFSHIGNRLLAHLESRVDFCKSNRSRVGKRQNWNLGNWRGRGNDQQPSHKTIQKYTIPKKQKAKKQFREYRNFDDIPIVLPLFVFLLLKSSINELKWNETKEYLAASSSDGFIKVKFHSFVVNWLTNGKTTGKRRRHWFRIFLLLFQIWSIDSDDVKTVHSFKVDSRCCRLVWRPNGKRKTEDVDGGIAAARKLKENLTIAW